MFASGNGGNFEAICRSCSEGSLHAEVALCVCDRPGAMVERRARRLGIPLLSLNPEDFATKREYEAFIVDRLKERGIDLICFAGYMRIAESVLLGAYGGRILNIHPSLLPAYKGARAISDAFRNGERRYGVTVHYVDETIDGGPILAQESLEYHGSDIEELERYIHRIEHRLYPAVIGEVLDSTCGSRNN